MLSKIFDWFETRIVAFPDEPPVRPPDTLWAFYWHYLQPVWPIFVVLLVVGFIGTIIEVALLAWVGSIVDWMRAAPSPEAFWQSHKWALIGMGFVALVMRPLISTAHDLIKNQMIAPPLTTRLRWQMHRYVLRQSLSFFQNDFAGRIANHVMQTGGALAHVGDRHRRERLVRGDPARWHAADVRRRRLAPDHSGDPVGRGLRRSASATSCRRCRNSPPPPPRAAPWSPAASSTATPTSRR